jgi:hypothetical protein
MTSNILKKILAISCLILPLALGIIWTSEQYQIQLGRECHNHLQSIETAKLKFAEENPLGEPQTHTDILKYLPEGRFPTCPHGGSYSNTLSHSNQVKCSNNGNPKTEPTTPKTNPLLNGYCDLEKEAETQTIITKIQKIFKQFSGNQKEKKNPLNHTQNKPD